VHGSIATDTGRPALPTNAVSASWRVSVPTDETGHLPVSGPQSRLGRRVGAMSPGGLGVVLVAVAAIAYVVSNPLHDDLYNHFVWQADAWLHGHLPIAYPVSSGPFQNWYFQDVMPDPRHPGFGILPFPPLPAVVLLPVVALMGMATPASLVAALLGAVDVGLAWRLCRRLAADRGVALVATAFLAFGTVAWYAAAIGTTWFLAHVVALGLSLLAVTIAVDADPASPPANPHARVAAVGPSTPGYGSEHERRGGLLGGGRATFVAALLLGLASLARLTVVFGLPFLFLVGGGSWRRRVVLAVAGAAIPLTALAGYNLATTGQLFNPAYAAIARTEYRPDPSLYHADWGVEDVRYIPQNLVIALLRPPQVRPECGLALLDPACGTVQPDPIGMGLLLTSPACLLVLPALRRLLRDRLVAGATLAVVLIGLADAAHFSQGWVQFGWRFSNDFVAFTLVPITLVMARMGLNRRVVALVGLSVLVNLWGVYWGVVLGW
jgi:hypothetical protein